MKSSISKREAQARYRERNKEELRRKAREAMARRRAQRSPEESIAHRAAAREDSARYRTEHRAALAERALVYRARKSIAKIGYAAWVAKYQERHRNQPIPAVLTAQYRDLTGPEEPRVPTQPNHIGDEREVRPPEQPTAGEARTEPRVPTQSIRDEVPQLRQPSAGIETCVVIFVIFSGHREDTGMPA
ncbi:hypothetical protein DFH06DRAFT_1194940 [Mycena polygramma]|nr:hypothetical protein DFH06DRAFT_1194940 [Mycena polygramma]